jgi:hypothetical protein
LGIKEEKLPSINVPFAPRHCPRKEELPLTSFAAGCKQ